METRTRKWEELAPHPNNPRYGDVDSLKESLTLNGQYKPIVTTTNGTILAGNHTYLAAGELEWDELECVVLDLDPFGPEATRIMLVDNRTSELGTMNGSEVHALLETLEHAEGGLLGTGYEPADMPALLINDPVSFGADTVLTSWTVQCTPKEHADLVGIVDSLILGTDHESKAQALIHALTRTEEAAHA